MNKWLFVEVQTYRSVNNMGKELGEYVVHKYDQTVVHKDSINDISNDIKEKMAELEQKYPRCKPLKYETRVYSERYGGVFDLSAKPDNPQNDNYAFILRTKSVRKNVADGMLKSAKDYAYFAGSEAMRENVIKEVKGIIDSLQKRCKPDPMGTLEECIAAAQIEALKLVIEVYDYRKKVYELFSRA